MILRINSDAIIPHAKLKELSPIFVSYFYSGALSMAHKLDRIDHQVLKNLTDPSSITADSGKIVGHNKFYSRRRQLVGA